MKKKIKIAGIIFGLVMVVLAGLYLLIYRGIPYYKTSKNFQVTKFTKDRIQVGVDVICYNPNNIAIRLSNCAFDVYANGKFAAKVNQKYGTTVAAASEFKVPLKVGFSPLKVFKARDLLGATFLSLKSKKIDLRFDGNVVVTVAGKDIEIDVDFADYLALKP